MLRKLTIKNFKGWKSGTFHFVEGVNMFKGKSETGKTCILNALEWVLYNRPTGDEYRRHGTKTTEVTVWFDDLEPITRIKSKTKNVYKYGDKQYTGFGSKVPGNIAKLINLDDLNILSQHDLHFLLGKNWTPSKVGQYINEVMNLEIIDKTMSNISKMLKQSKREYQNKKQLLVEYRSELKQFSYLKEVNSLIQHAQELENEISELKEKEQDIYEHIGQKELYLVKLKKLKILDISDEIEHGISLIDTIGKLEDKISEITYVQENITLAKNSMLKNEKLSKELESQFKKDFPDQCPLCGDLK